MLELGVMLKFGGELSQLKSYKVERIEVIKARFIGELSSTQLYDIEQKLLRLGGKLLVF